MEGKIGERYADEFGLGSVDEVAEDPAAATKTLTVLFRSTEPAASAAGDAGHQNPCPHVPTAGSAGLDNRADRFVSEDTAWRDLRYMAAQNVQIRAADRCGVHLHDCVAIVLQLGDRHIRPRPLAVPAIHKGFHRQVLLG